MRLARGTFRRSLLGAIGAICLPAAAAGLTGPVPATEALAAARTAAPPSCHLQSRNGDVQHVIHLTFDNVHLARDYPGVPSDLEQMPHLLSFLEQNGTVLANHHTPLIAHTGTDLLTELTGVYGDRHGMPQSNSFRYYHPDGTTSAAGSFAYWTDPLYDFNTPAQPTDTTPEMIDELGRTAPAPWVPYTRAGCDYAAIASANTVLENVKTDIPTVFGASSPEQAEASSDPGLATTDFVGLAVHCGSGGGACNGAGLNPKADRLPDEPGGYNGFRALYGAKYVSPALGGPATDVNGSVIRDAQGRPGFPGFDGMTAAVSLGYVAAMQEHGVPVTYAYISDAHDNHQGGGAYGPGQDAYVAALRSYDAAFASFFERLRHDGIDQSNTLFVVTSDENDHFAGVRNKTGCDGVTVPCTYAPGEIGELDTNLSGLLATQRNNTTPFTTRSDSAPGVYVTGNPARGSSTVRTLERDTAALTANNPFSGVSGEVIANYLADPVEMKLLHLQAADPARLPTFTLFAKPDYYIHTGAPNCSSPCVKVNPAFAWIHGDYSPDINTTWLGLAGPGIRRTGVDSTTWSDHTDVRPTILALLGLEDDYRHDGRVLVEALDDHAVDQSLFVHRDSLLRLMAVDKQLDACVGQFAGDTLTASTRAIVSGSAADDSTYQQVAAELQALGDRRDQLVDRIAQVLTDAEFHHRPVDEQQAQQLVDQGNAILGDAHHLATG